MTQEDKDLLLKDLCARLPYGVKVFVSGNDFDNYQYPYLLTAISKFGHDSICKVYSPVYTPFGSPNIENVKPYLRPISSMTEEEMDKLFDILHIDKDGKDDDWIKINDDLGIKFFFPTGKWIEDVADAYDYLYSIHIDFRGLIPKGLALEAPKDMYNIK